MKFSFLKDSLNKKIEEKQTTHSKEKSKNRTKTDHILKGKKVKIEQKQTTYSNDIHHFYSSRESSLENLYFMINTATIAAYGTYLYICNSY